MRINSCVISGQIQGELKLRMTNSNVPVTTMTIVTNQPTRNGGVHKVRFKVSLWRDLAEYVCEHYSEGDVVLVDGYLRCSYFKDFHKKRIKVVEIIARNVIKYCSDDFAVTNRCYLSGEIGVRPEITITKNDEPMLSMMMYGEGGDPKNKEQFKVVAWNGVASEIYENYNRGERVVVIGRLSCNFWTDENGYKKTTVVLTAEKILPVSERKVVNLPVPEESKEPEEQTYIEHDDLIFEISDE